MSVSVRTVVVTTLLTWFAATGMIWAAQPQETPASETPDFQRHVIPLLGTLGCNGRACHGSFQGRGDLRLSLFGYDFEMDHNALTDRSSSEDRFRVDSANVDLSLILQKPLLQIDHEGGQRFEEGSWEHRLLKKWIQAGAKGVGEPRELKELVVEPRHVEFSAAQERVALRVVAHWQDGVQEDVTTLCRFRSNNDSVVTVDRKGVLVSRDPGDTYVVTFYDNGVASVPVIQASLPRRAPNRQIDHAIDQLVDRKLARLGVEPSQLCTDAEFLRRVSIDVLGSLPTPDEVRDFLADNSQDKRERKIRELLDQPEYAAWWANKLCDFTGCNPRQQAELGQELAVQWYDWIRRRVGDNTPYDELVAGIFLATGRQESQNYEAYATEFTSYFRDEDPADFSLRSNMPHYWSRRSVKEAKAKALAVAHSFLGLIHWLEENFIASGFDMKWLHVQILTSHTYQRSWRPNKTNRLDTRNYSRAIQLQPLIAEAYLRCLSRPPTKKETARTQQHIDAVGSASDGLGSLLWALVNTKEFILQH